MPTSHRTEPTPTPAASLTDWVERYKAAQKAAIDAIPADAVARLVGRFKAALADDRQVFVFGNGGSAANASHFVTDLGKGSSDKQVPHGADAPAGSGRRRFRVMALNDNVSWMTALGNDYAYEDVFLGQLQNWGRRGDLVLVLSVSGNSPNLVKAVKWAKAHGLHTAALVGGKRGALADLADECIVIPDAHYGRAEDGHMAVCHMVCYAFMELPELTGGGPA